MFLFSFQHYSSSHETFETIEKYETIESIVNIRRKVGMQKTQHKDSWS